MKKLMALVLAGAMALSLAACGGGDSSSAAGTFTSNIFAFPTTYVVDRNGNIVGEPIVGAITEKNQAETLQSLIDQAIAADAG